MHGRKLNDLHTKIRATLLQIPNLVHESVPDGKDDSENKVEKTVGKKPKFSFTPKSHVDLLEQNDWADFERAAKISGARWYFLKGDLAVLDFGSSFLAVDCRANFSSLNFTGSNVSINSLLALIDLGKASPVSWSFSQIFWFTVSGWRPRIS